jgi:hypothetical protein
MVGYAANHSPHAYKVFKHEPGKAGEIIFTRNVRWVHWDHPNKSKSMDLSPVFTKVEGLNKDQKALLEELLINSFLITKCALSNSPIYQITKIIHSFKFKGEIG